MKAITNFGENMRNLRNFIRTETFAKAQKYKDIFFLGRHVAVVVLVSALIGLPVPTVVGLAFEVITGLLRVFVGLMIAGVESIEFVAAAVSFGVE